MSLSLSLSLSPGWPAVLLDQLTVCSCVLAIASSKSTCTPDTASGFTGKAAFALLFFRLDILFFSLSLTHEINHCHRANWWHRGEVYAHLASSLFFFFSFFFFSFFIIIYSSSACSIVDGLKVILVFCLRGALRAQEALINCEHRCDMHH